MKFMLLFAGGDPDRTIGARQSKEKEDQMRRWGEWLAGLSKQGVLESGRPFLETGRVVTRDSVTEFHKGKRDFAGYVILEVPDEEEAIAIAKTAPHIVYGGTTVIRPCAEIPE